VYDQQCEILSKKVLLLHDSARPHTAGQTVETINHLGFEVLVPAAQISPLPTIISLDRSKMLYGVVVFYRKRSAGRGA
jgi:hypothetical protein